MDDGYVIQNLGEPWTFAGARLFEWCCGLAVGFVAQEMFLPNLGASMPIFMGLIIGTTLLMVQLRKNYPDEERGLMNHVIASLGFNPPMIPPPANLQSLWSGAPIRDLDPKKEFVELGLMELDFNAPLEDEEQIYRNKIR